MSKQAYLDDYHRDIENAETAHGNAPIDNPENKSFTSGTYTFTRWMQMLSYMNINSADAFSWLFYNESIPTQLDSVDISIETIPEFNTLKVYFPDKSHAEFFGLDDYLFNDLEAFAEMEI